MIVQRTIAVSVKPIDISIGEVDRHINKRVIFNILGRSLLISRDTT